MNQTRASFLVSGIFLLSALFASAQERLTEVDLIVNGLRSGSGYPTVIKTLGRPNRTKREYYKPDEGCSAKAETHVTLFYPGLKVALLGDDEGRSLQVYSLELTSKKWNGSGAKIGDTIMSVKSRFGKPNSTHDGSGETILYYVTKGNQGGVNFYFRDGILQRVRMNETLC